MRFPHSCYAGTAYCIACLTMLTTPYNSGSSEYNMPDEHQLRLTSDEVNTLRFCLGQGQKRVFEVKSNKEYKTADKNKAQMYEFQIEALFKKLREIEV